MPRNQITARQDQIRRAVAKLARGGKRRYPARLRRRIADYARNQIETDVSLTQVSSDLGVGHPTLIRLLEEAPPRMRRVRVAAPSRVTADSSAALVVRGPGGIVIEGLDVDGAAALLRALA